MLIIAANSSLFSFDPNYSWNIILIKLLTWPVNIKWYGLISHKVNTFLKTEIAQKAWMTICML